jgi:hypothetical protein
MEDGRCELQSDYCTRLFVSSDARGMCSLKQRATRLALLGCCWIQCSDSGGAWLAVLFGLAESSRGAGLDSVAQRRRNDYNRV